MPHGTPGLTPRERFRARLLHYAGFALLFAVVYVGLVRWLGSFPEPLLLAILGGSLLKDVVDEVRLHRGGQPVAYAGIEHAPSNAVLIVLIAVGVVDPAGTVGPVSTRTLALAVAAVDLLFDLWQDARA